MNLEEFCDRFQALLNQGRSAPLLGEASRQLLRDLLQDPSWFGEFLQKFIADPAFLSDQPGSFFDNEIKLFRSPERSFSLLAYIWDTREMSVIHDHGSWGLFGVFIRPFREIKYQRVDSKQVEGFAELKVISDTVIEAGEVGTVFPLDKGIHQTGAAENQLTITLHVYGRSLRKGYIHYFDPAEKKVSPVLQASSVSKGFSPSGPGCPGRSGREKVFNPGSDQILTGGFSQRVSGDFFDPR